MHGSPQAPYRPFPSQAPPPGRGGPPAYPSHLVRFPRRLILGSGRSRRGGGLPSSFYLIRHPLWLLMIPVLYMMWAVIWLEWAAFVVLGWLVWAYFVTLGWLTVLTLAAVWEGGSSLVRRLRG